MFGGHYDSDPCGVQKVWAATEGKVETDALTVYVHMFSIGIEILIDITCHK